MRHFTEEDPKIQQRHDEHMGNLSTINSKLSKLIAAVQGATVAVVLPLVYLIVKDLF